MNAARRILAILDLFEEDAAIWTVEDAAAALDVSISTAYRDFRTLGEAQLLVPDAGDGYRLGPALLRYERLTRRTDPLLEAAGPILERLQDAGGDGAAVFLARLFRDSVMSVLSSAGPQAPNAISFERGRPMPMFRGATSKIILAYLPRRSLKRLYDRHGPEIDQALGSHNWHEFLKQLSQLRREGLSTTTGEVDPGLTGMASPVFDARGSVIASITLVARTSLLNAGTRAPLADTVRRAAQALTRSQAT